MTKKRVHEIAKEQGIPSKELLERLRAAGVAVKAVASSVDESLALRALAATAPPATSTLPPQPAEAAASRAAARGPPPSRPRPRPPPRPRHQSAHGAPPRPPVAGRRAGARQPRRRRAGRAPLRAEPPPADEPGRDDRRCAGRRRRMHGERVRPTRDSRTGERAPAAPAREAAAAS